MENKGGLLMDVLECIKTRRSIRRFTDRPISEETLSQVLEAVKWAPSWANTQTCEIVLIKDAKAKEKIAGLLAPNNPATKGVLQAPVLVVICAKMGSAGFKNNEEVTNKGDWSMFDAGIASQNLCLAAHSLGLGTVHVAYLDHQALDEYLALPDDVQSIEVIPVGYPARVGNAPPRRDLSEFVHKEKYGEKF